MKYPVIDRQSIFDIALITTGAAENAIKIALDNGQKMSTRFIEGTEINIENITDQKIVNYFSVRDAKPATCTTKKIFAFDRTFDITFRPIV